MILKKVGCSYLKLFFFLGNQTFSNVVSESVDGIDQLSSNCVTKLRLSNSAAVDKMARISFVVIKIEAALRFRILLAVVSAILGSTCLMVQLIFLVSVS